MKNNTKYDGGQKFCPPFFVKHEDMMKKQCYNLSEVEPMMQRMLAEGGTFQFYPHGTSMLPLIREDRDQVILTAVPEKLEKYQVILYKRKNDAFVLHRIVDVEETAEGQVCTMRGDHQYVDEHGIRKEQMLGMVCGIIRNGKTVDPCHGTEYLKAVWWVKTMKIRRKLWSLRRAASKIKRIFVKK